MPVYLHLANLIIRKDAVAIRYPGGIEQFRIDYQMDEMETRQEDDELFLIAQMNTDDFYLDELVAKGLHYDLESNFSSDFTLFGRYDPNFEWKADWLEHNGVFAWHIETNDELKRKVAEISEMHVEDIFNEMAKGNNLLQTIRLEN